VLITLNIKSEDIISIVDGFNHWSKLEGATILVSGANGFLPAYMVETILFLNDTVFNKKAKLILIVRSIKNASARFGSDLERSDVLVLEQDISKNINIELNIDYVIHAASFASPKYYSTVPVDVITPNVIGTHNLLELSRQKNIKSFLFFSSAEVYGTGIKDPIKEEDGAFINQLYTRACYSESKRMGEALCVAYLRQYNIPVKIVRPFHTYGPGMKLDDGRVFADFVRCIVNRQPIQLLSSGASKRSFCYLSDATLAFFMVLINGVDGEAYNVGNPNCEFSILDLAISLANAYAKDGVKLEHNIKQTGNVYYDRVCPSIAKITKLGWMPNVNIIDGFDRTIKSFEVDQYQ